jgi:transcriptional regulator with XRE-family HTH domain
MSKRNKVILETAESKFLKEARISSGMSLQKLADLLQVSKQQVHLMETGRANISDDYLRLFKEKVGIIAKESKPICAQPPKESGPSIKQLCLAKIEKLPAAELEKLNSYLDQLLFFNR